MAESPWLFGNLEERDNPSLEAVTRGLVKTRLTEQTSVCAVVNCRVWEIPISLELIVVMICKCSINPVTNQNPGLWTLSGVLEDRYGDRHFPVGLSDSWRNGPREWWFRKKLAAALRRMIRRALPVLRAGRNGNKLGKKSPQRKDARKEKTDAQGKQ
jgi:hypothetical protein